MSGVEALEHDLTKKFGPLPMWAWGALLGAVAVAFMYMHRSGSSSTSASTDSDDTTADAVQDANDGALSTGNDQGDASDASTSADQAQIASLGDAVSGLQSSVDALSAGSATSTDDDSVAAATAGAPAKHHNKELWVRKATAALSGKGVPALQVQTALSKYLNGKPLTARQKHIVSQAIAAEGVAPGSANLTVKTAHEKHPAHEAKHDKGHETKHPAAAHHATKAEHHETVKGPSKPPKKRPTRDAIRR